MAWQGGSPVGAEPHIPRFGGWAGLYQRYRPHYPEALFSLLCDVSPGCDLCVEIGAGTGQATGDLARGFQRVIAVEPDPDMARLIACPPGGEVIVAEAEAVAIEPGGADAVVAATSLHWMDEQAVLARAARWLRPGGVMMAFAFVTPHLPGAGPSLLCAIQAHQRRVRPFMHDRILGWRGTERALAAAPGFGDVASFEIYADFLWLPQEVAGFLLTMSAGRAYAEGTGDPEAAFSALAEEIAAACHGHPILIRFPIEGAWARRQGPPPGRKD